MHLRPQSKVKDIKMECTDNHASVWTPAHTVWKTQPFLSSGNKPVTSIIIYLPFIQKYLNLTGYELINFQFNIIFDLDKGQGHWLLLMIKAQ